MVHSTEVRSGKRDLERGTSVEVPESPGTSSLPPWDTAGDPPQGIAQETDRVPEDNGGEDGTGPEELVDEVPTLGICGTTATGVDYEHINTRKRLNEYLTGLRTGTSTVAIDFETTDLRPRFAALVGIALSTDGTKGIYISGDLGLDLVEVLEEVLAACTERELVAHNAVYELSIIANVLGRGRTALAKQHADHQLGLGINSSKSLSRQQTHLVRTSTQVENLERAALRGLNFHDTMIIARLLGYDHQIGLKAQANIQYGVTMQEISALIGKGVNQITMADVPARKAAPYAADDVIYTWRLFADEYDKMPPGVRSVYEDIERPVLPISAHMGLSGMDLNAESIATAKLAVTKRIEDLNAEIQTAFKAAVKSGHVRLELEPMPTKRNPDRTRTIYIGPTGDRIGPPTSTSHPKSALWEYNPGSNKQAPGFLGLPDAQAGTYELSGMPLALTHRDLDHFRKLLSSYINPVERMLHDGGRAYFSLNQAGTGTGRFSASGWKIKGDPWGINGQTMPKPKANEDPKDPMTESKLVRRQFQADLPAAGCCGRDELHDHILVEADYSQIELRVEAHIADERNMIRAYLEGRDLHDEMMRLSGLKDRRLAKVANFGCSYEDNDWIAAGVVKRNAAKSDIIVTDDEAMETVQFFRAAWPDLKKYYAMIHNRITDYGYVETLFGRRLYRSYVPNGNKPKWYPEVDDDHDNYIKYMLWMQWKSIDKVNAARRREGINMPIQGTAAEILKIALTLLWDTLPEWVTIKITVHDSIIFQCPSDMVDELLAWAIPKMESKSIIELAVPLKADAEVGPNWADMKEVEHAA